MHCFRNGYRAVNRSELIAKRNGVQTASLRDSESLFGMKANKSTGD